MLRRQLVHINFHARENGRGSYNPPVPWRTLPMLKSVIVHGAGTSNSRGTGGRAEAVRDSARKIEFSVVRCILAFQRAERRCEV